MVGMAKEKAEREKGRMLVGVVWSCTDTKLLLASLLCLFSVVAVVHLFPARTALSASVFRTCLSSFSPPAASAAANATANATANANATEAHPLKREATLSDGFVKRAFNPVGSAAYLFVQMGAYRGGLDTFAVIGLASKPLHVFAKPEFRCEWVPHDGNASVSANGSKILPDWGYGRVYTVVVVNCTFPAAVGADASGGRLVLHATGSVDDEVSITALEEAPGSLDVKLFTAPPKYEYLYCGSPLYGNLSPQRVREWLAYHARLFGEGRSHFVLHDAGGVHPGVAAVLQPWVERGLVTVQDIRDQERFDGYYHNQFMVVNDCLHRYRFAAKWIFFFDLDEYIYIKPKSNIKSVLDSLSGYTQFTIVQVPMSNKICTSSDAGRAPRMWGMEKLVYRDVKRVPRRDRKYAIQPRNAFATGVHMSQNVVGRSQHKTEELGITYFHYHGTIAQRREPCGVFTNATEITVDGTPYVRDDTLRNAAAAVRRFELRTIGSRLVRTRQ